MGRDPVTSRPAVLLSALDITRIKRAEEDAKTQKSAKNQALLESKIKTELLSSLVHELRTPMNSIISYCIQLIAAHDDVDANGDKNYDDLHRHYDAENEKNHNFNNRNRHGSLNSFRRIKSMLNIILRSSKFMLNIINDFFEYTRLETGKMRLDNAGFNIYSLITGKSFRCPLVPIPNNLLIYGVAGKKFRYLRCFIDFIGR